MTHPIIEDLNKRYTTKRYDPTKKVSEADLNVLLEAMRLSISSINSQPWKFIVIESDDAKTRFEKTISEKFKFNQRHVFECSHIILFAHNPRYSRDDYADVVDTAVRDGNIPEDFREQVLGAYSFVESNTDEAGYNRSWTRPQTYIALGNAIHTLARMNIDSTTMEGFDPELLSQEFAQELDGYECNVVLAIGYRDINEDYNATLPKSRLPADKVIIKL